MPELKNAKRERFCREYVIDLNATRAYIRAGYSKIGATPNAARLIANDIVSARIDELRSAVSEKLEITQEKVLRHLDESRTAAAKDGQHAAAIKATELLGKHIGMWPNKAEVNIHNHLEGLTVEQLAALRAVVVDAIADAEGAPAGDRSAIH